jgi:hypothetical protein
MAKLLRLALRPEVKEGFLHSGTAKYAVPPVGMTDLMTWTYSTVNKNGAGEAAPPNRFLIAHNCYLIKREAPTRPWNRLRSSPPTAPESPAACGSTHPATHGSS